MIKIYLLIDNGHGIGTLGKCSPDGRLREYAWTREVAQMLAIQLRSHGIEAQLLVTEVEDVPLIERVRRVNAACDKYGADNCLLVSLHNNGAGADGQWHNASGWSVFVSPRASQASRALAQSLYAAADKRGLRGNRYVPQCRYWEANYYILRKTKCPAVLTENLFQDNRDDVDYLLSEEGKRMIVAAHVEGILNYLKNRA